MSGCRMRGPTKNENISSTILLVTRGVKNLHNEALPNDLSVNMANNSETGRLFQILGPATEKPSRVFVLGTVRTLA